MSCLYSGKYKSSIHILESVVIFSVCVYTYVCICVDRIEGIILFLSYIC